MVHIEIDSHPLPIPQIAIPHQSMLNEANYHGGKVKNILNMTK